MLYAKFWFLKAVTAKVIGKMCLYLAANVYVYHPPIHLYLTATYSTRHQELKTTDRKTTLIAKALYIMYLKDSQGLFGQPIWSPTPWCGPPCIKHKNMN